MKADATPGSRWALGACAAILTVGAVLRLRGLGAHGLWTDELVSWWAVSAGSFGELLKRCSGCMATPPLSFLGQRLAVAVLGRSEWGLRLPSVLYGVATIGVVFVAGRRMFGREAGLIAAALLAVHPFHIGFSVDARPYALAILLAALSIWSWSELAARPSPGWIALYALASAGLLYTQFVFAPLLLAQAAAWLLSRSGRMAGAPAFSIVGAAFGATALLSLPLLPQLVSVAGRASSLTWAATEEYPPWIYWFVQTTPLFVALLLGLVLSLRAGSSGVALASGRGEERFAALSLALTLLLPSLLIGFLAVARRLPSIVKPRYGAAYLGAAVLLVAFLLTRLRETRVRRATLFAYLSLIVVTQVVPPLVGGRSFSADADLEGWNQVARVLREERRPNDAVLLRSPLVETAQLFAGSFPPRCAGYLAAPLGDFYLPERPEIVLLPPQVEGPPYPPLYAARIAARIAGRDRLWLVLAGAPDPDAYLQAVLDLAQAASGRSWAVESVRSFGLVSMALLSRAS